jgi:hypothetical protein
MRIITKIVVGTAVAGVVAATGSAFTGTGLTSNAGASQYVGGTITQSITGATLTSIVYSFGDVPANTAVHSVALTFAGSDADGKTPTVSFTGGTVVGFTCTAIDGTTHVSTCTTDGVDRVGITSVDVSV